MNLAAINQTIKAMCPEVGALGVSNYNWSSLTEEELLHEAATCMFSSQMRFEVAVAAADRVMASGLLRWEEIGTKQLVNYEAVLQTILSKPVSVEVNGMPRQMRPRFRNRLAYLFSRTVDAIYRRGSSLREILFSVKSPRHARKCLAETVSGFGPKQASLFLRRVGFCSELAILDTHILDYLKMARGIDPKPGAISRLSSYELIETEFQRVAAEFGYAVGCVDLAIWITMRVAKRKGLV